MKIETKLKRALETPEPKLKYMRLVSICLSVLPHCPIWETAHAEIDKMYKEKEINHEIL